MLCVHHITNLFQTTISVHGADVSVHGADVSVHGADVIVHGADVSVHGADLSVHGADLSVHGVTSGASRALVNSSGTHNITRNHIYFTLIEERIGSSFQSAMWSHHTVCIS